MHSFYVDALVNQECGVAKPLPPHLHVSGDRDVMIACRNHPMLDWKLAEPIVEIVKFPLGRP